MTDIEGEATEEEPTVNLPAVRASEAIVARGELTVDEVVAQRDKILQIMQRVMRPGVHYGVIPGVNKPSLFKPGAEAIDVALRLAPHYTSEKIWHDDGHLTVAVVCELRHIPTDLVIATGEGLCSTRETKYAYRTGGRVCPSCGSLAIIKGKAEYGGGWICYAKKGGCGSKWSDDSDEAFVFAAAEVGRVANEDIADSYNTVLKMADKRSLIAAVLNGTAASDVFTQDVEDRPAAEVPENPRSQERRVDGPAKYPVPKTWAKVQEAVLHCDNSAESWLIFEAYVRAASYHLFGETEGKKLEPEQRKVMLQKAAGAAVWLHDTPHAGREGEFLYFTEAVQRQAFAAVLDGTLLEIPDYTAPKDEPDADRAEAERLQAEYEAAVAE